MWCTGDRCGGWRQRVALPRGLSGHQELSGRDGRREDPAVHAGNVPRCLRQRQLGGDFIAELGHHL